MNGSGDWLGNLTASEDDRFAFWDRGMGPLRTRTAAGRPYTFQDAGDLALSTWGGTGSADAPSYDETGNITELRVNRTGQCTNGTTTCNARYLYYFDELGRLQEARRHDGTPLAAQLLFTYDSNDNRVIKSDVLPSGVVNDRHTLYVFDSLEVRRSAHTVGTARYTVDSQTQVPYLVANGIRLGRVVYEGAADGEPRFDAAGRRHVFLNVGDHLGSTSIVIDHATSELVERMTYQPYGATESDYRPPRWKGFREDYRFTGKEEDVEVGLTYFGKRFLVAPLGRWLTPDPLAVHAPGEADYNLYAYVDGAVLRLFDPIGLDPPTIKPATEPNPLAIALAEGLESVRRSSAAGITFTVNWVYHKLNGSSDEEATFNSLDATRSAAVLEDALPQPFYRGQHTSGVGSPVAAADPPSTHRRPMMTETLATVVQAAQNLRADTNPKFRLTGPNALRAVRGLDGSLGSVAGPGGKGADVVFADGFKREVKSILGNFNSFNRAVSHGIEQLVGSSGVAAGEVFVQVKAGTDVANFAARFSGKRSAEQREKYKDVTLRIVNDNGEELYHGPVAPQSSSESEGGQ